MNVRLSGKESKEMMGSIALTLWIVVIGMVGVDLLWWFLVLK